MKNKTFYKLVAWSMIAVLILAVGLSVEEYGFFKLSAVVAIIVACYKLGLWREDRYRPATHSLTEY